MIGDPDPYTATMNALQSFRVDEIVISTLPANQARAGCASDLIERVARRRAASPSSTSRPESRADAPAA